MAPTRPATPGAAMRQPDTRQIDAETKQKMIDNLQIEVTKRARTLRAQAARSATSLQSRVAKRSILVPAHLRKVTMGALLDSLDSALVPKENQITTSSVTMQLPTTKITYQSPVRSIASPYKSMSKKRTSDDMIGSDKENQGSNIDVPKKRSRVAAVPKSAAETQAARTGSRKINPSQVLSPKSNNSRTLPQSPLKPTPSAPKYYASRPASPIKSTVTSAMPPPEKPRAARQKAAAPKAVAAPVAAPQSKRGAAPVASTRPANNRIASDSSTASAMSTGTTIVTKKTAVPKKGMMSKMQGMASAAGRRVVGTKKEAVPAAVAETGRRVLRSRK